MPARVQIEIDVKDAASGVLRAITTQFGALGKVGSDFADMIRSSDGAVKLYNKALIDTSISVDDVRKAEELAAIATGRFYEQVAMLAFDALKDVINTTVEYAQEVRDLSLLQGQGTEAASRFLQVLDDYQLTADDAKLATRALTKEGLAPTIETIAELSAQYNALTDVQEKNAFVQKNLGRSGQEWMNLLAQGPDKIRAMNDAVSDGLILSAENIKAAEDYRLALDEWGDAVQEMKVSFGTQLLPSLAEGLKYSLESGKAVQEEVKWYERLVPAVGAIHSGYIAVREAVTNNTEATQSGTTANGEYASSLEEVEARMKAQEEAAKALEKETTTYYKGLISSIQDMQSEIDRFNDKNSDLYTKQSEINAAIADATRRYGANSQKVKELQGDLADVGKELQENAAAHQKWAAQTVFAFAQARAAADGNISKGEGEMLIAVGEQLDLFDQKTADAMRSVNEAFDDLDASNAESTINAVQRAMEKLTGKTWTINITTNTSGVNVPDPNDNAGMPDYYQSGGQVYAGGLSWVGEGGAEPFVPATNGRILGHSEALHALQMGGGGNYFYGPVSISAGSDAGGDILDLR